MRSRTGNETIGSGGHQKWQPSLGGGRIETATQQIDPGSLSGTGFLRGFDVDMGQAPFAFELSQVVDGVLLAGSEHERHGVELSPGPQAVNGTSLAGLGAWSERKSGENCWKSTQESGNPAQASG